MVPDQKLTSMSISVDADLVERAARALIDAVAPPARIILFGLNEMGGDLKFLVIADEVGDRFKETARLDKILGQLLIPADVVVVSGEEADRPQQKGSIIDRALTSGQVIAEL
jgi:hypothetical protein